MENDKAQIRVFTQKTDPDRYPDGLAGSIHFAVTIDGKETVINRDYGILFATGKISEDNTIEPMKTENPAAFIMPDQTIGILAERIREDGTKDPEDAGRFLMWTTDDLIRFSGERSVSRDSIPAGCLSDRIDVDRDIVQNALNYWNPIVCSKVEVPERIPAASEADIIKADALITYSDGSTRKKNVLWDTRGVDFDRPGEYRISGRITQQKFKFPLAKGYGDPVIFPWEGKWYYISTNDNTDDIGIYVREAADVHGLFAENTEEHLILPFDPERGFEQTFWAPEFHVIGGELYILFAVSGHSWGPQCHMMRKKKTGSIIDADGWEDPVRVCRMDGSPLATDAITLDMTFVRAEKKSYVIWSYREHIMQKNDSGSMLFIASIDETEPWKLTCDPVLLSRPLYGWENVSGTINNEGPFAFQKDGMIYVTYSGGAANGYTYALGLLSARADSELTDLSAWSKSITPVLTFRSVRGEYGPGHNAFFVNEDNELMISYHAETDIHEHLRCDGIRRVHFRKDGTPYFQMAAEEDVKDTTVTATVVVGKPAEPSL